MKWFLCQRQLQWQNSNVEFIVATFNENTWKAIHVIAIYKSPKIQALHQKDGYMTTSMTTIYYLYIICLIDIL
jgi:hypothetical protein